MPRSEFRLTSAQALPNANNIIRAFIQTNSSNLVIGSLTESNVGNVTTLFFAVRDFGGNTGILVTATLENDISFGEIDVTVDQDGAVFNHSPIAYPGDIP
jgi:hypothetical protein